MASTESARPETGIEVRAEGVRHVYRGGTVALHGVDLAIGTGLFGLLGPNGAGKSTLMRIICSLLPPTEGRVTVGGLDVVGERLAVRRLIGYLPQDFGVYPRISCWELLNHLALLKGLVDTRARHRQISALLDQTNLVSHRRRSVSSFSGGMRQRFGIAQALIGDPRLVIVDEPTAGLDPEERNRFHNLLAGISESTLVLLSTHIVEDIANLCSRFAVMDQGRIQVEGDTGGLLQEMAGQVWERQVGRHDLEAIEGRHRVLSHRLSRGRHLVRVLSDTCPDGGFSAATPTLEDVYFATLGRARGER
jgi:ABC-2 type transport system ATP-binding protein